MQQYKLNETNMRFCGLIKKMQSGVVLQGAGAFLEFCGKIQKISILVNGCSEEEDYRARLALLIDDNPNPEAVWTVENGSRRYEAVLPDKSDGPVVIRILKLTEFQYGTVELTELSTDGDIRPTKKKERRILFIGNSLTAGYGVCGSEKDERFTTQTEDVTRGYSWLTARALHADPWMVAWSGCGVLSRWIPPEETGPRTDHLMPEVFAQETRPEFDPQLILINIGTNDASYTRGNREREAAFTEKYVSFVKQVAMVYPEAEIVLLYGMMEVSLREAVAETAYRCMQEGMDCSFYELPLMEPGDGFGTDAHPSKKTHEKTAGVLTAFLTEKMHWSK